MKVCSLAWFTAAWLLAGGGVRGQVVINEIHYHPVERPAFDAAGDPVLDLSDEVHEFIELKNPGAGPVSLAGWRLAGGVECVFPPEAVIPAGGLLVVAKNPERLEAVGAYALNPGSVFGPWRGGLNNGGESLRLETMTGIVADAVAYSSARPWPVGANAFGAETEWTGIDEIQHQYRGRSLERLSPEWSGNDPANWLASPVASGPSPGRPNAVSRHQPLPVVLDVSAVQEATGAVVIRSGEPVVVEARFSSIGAGVSAARVEFFKDETNSTSEMLSTAPMTLVVGQPGLWRAVLPGQANRSLVRYRLLADRGEGIEIVSPRVDDPYAWHAWFVTPVRAGTRPQYDVFVASAALSTLASNISGIPRRIVNPDPPGLPRASWNATQPAVLVRDGRVFDIRLRHHGSRYNRLSLRASFKVQFPRYARLDGLEGLFFKDKGDDHRVGTQLYQAAGLPSFTSRFVDIHLNANTVVQRLEVPEMDERHFEAFAAGQAARFPGTAVEPTGEFYKATGVVPFETGAGVDGTSVYTASGEGPYYIGNCAPIPDKPGWSARQRYDFTYGGQMHHWIGGRDTEAMLSGLWAARGDAPTAPNPNLPALRTWLQQHFDVEATLQYIAIRNWCAPFDDATHNYFLWRRASGRWAMLPWDLDGELGNSAQSIYHDEYSVPQPDTLRGPQWIKDSFLKAFRNEYRQTLWRLNNTILLPANFGVSGYNGAQSFAAARHANVNSQLGFGPFYRPATPAALAPVAGASALPGSSLVSSAYGHTAPAPVPAHASTTWIIRPAGGSWDAPAVRLTSPTQLTSLPIPFESLSFGSTYYWKCQHTDVDGHPSFESPESSFVFGTTGGGPPEVRLNEVLARGAGDDFIEIHNAGAAAAELGGMGLTDDPAAPPRMFIPAGTVLPAGGYFVVALDAVAPFRLDGDGQTVVLVRSDGAIADAVDFGPQAFNRSIGRGPSGWMLGPPTPGAANLQETTGPPDGLRINEWMASNPDGADWFEIVNSSAMPVSLSGLKLGNGTDDTTLPDHSFIGAGGFQEFVADRTAGPHHVDFKLSSSGETITLRDRSGAVVDTVNFGPQAGGVSEGRLPDGNGPVVRFPGQSTPGEANAFAIDDVVVSRVFPDIELFNRSSVPVVIDGWRLSDDPHDLAKHVIAAGFGAVPAGGSRVIAAASLPFDIDRTRGGQLVLSHGGTHRRRQLYGAWDGYSWGLVMRETGDLFVRIQPDPPTPGNIPVVGPVVVSEINYHPPDAPGDDAAYEFVEWLNTSGEPVDIGEWRLAGDAEFTVPSATVLPPGGRVVIAAVTPAAHAAWYDLAPGTLVLGPWSGGLPNSRGHVRLVRRLPPVTETGPDFGFRPEVELEAVEYRDTAPWPPAADGAGASLARQSPGGFAADAINWTAGAPSPGVDASLNQPPSITIVNPVNGSTAPAGSLIVVSVNASDPDGPVRRVIFEADGLIVATDDSAPFSFAWSSPVSGPHSLRVTAIDGRLSSASVDVTLSLTNDPPLAALLLPVAGARVATAEMVALEAAAFDPEGLLERVDFLVDGVVVGSAEAPPWRFSWSAGPAGHRLLSARAIDVTDLASTSPPVGIYVVGIPPVAPVIAYRVPAGTVGNQSYAGSLGHDFEVVSSVEITRLGVFDSGANGVSGTLTAQLWRNQPTPRLLATMAFSSASPGEIAPGTSNRFKQLATPLVLGPGSYTAVVYGYSDAERNGNAGDSQPAWTGESGDGLIRFVGSSRYGSAGQFPATVDGGPAYRYAGPTFEFIDADGDGDFMPSDWETTFGFDPVNPVDGAEDADGDGAANREEYAAGTDPRQSASRLDLELIEATAVRTTVRLVLPAARAAVLQSSRELTYWIDQETVPAATSARTIELSLPSEPIRYLRVMVKP